MTGEKNNFILFLNIVLNFWPDMRTSLYRPYLLRLVIFLKADWAVTVVR